MSTPPAPDGLTAEALRKIAGRMEWRQLTHEPTSTTAEQDAATLRGWADELEAHDVA